jgi:hypothetical protein
MTEPKQSVLSNAEIANRLASLAQLMAAGKENPSRLTPITGGGASKELSEGIDELVREDADLTAFALIGDAIAACQALNPSTPRSTAPMSRTPRRFSRTARYRQACLLSDPRSRLRPIYCFLPSCRSSSAACSLVRASASTAAF